MYKHRVWENPQRGIGISCPKGWRIVEGPDGYLYYVREKD